MVGEALFGAIICAYGSRCSVHGREDFFPSLSCSILSIFCFLICVSITAIRFITLLALSGGDNKYPAVGRCQH